MISRQLANLQVWVDQRDAARRQHDVTTKYRFQNKFVDEVSRVEMKSKILICSLEALRKPVLSIQLNVRTCYLSRK